MAVCSLLTLFFDSRIRMQNKVIRYANHSNTDATKVIRFPIEAPPITRKHIKGSLMIGVRHFLLGCMYYALHIFNLITLVKKNTQRMNDLITFPSCARAGSEKLRRN
jgi:hypothetical protein